MAQDLFVFRACLKILFLILVLDSGFISLISTIGYNHVILGSAFLRDNAHQVFTQEGKK